MKTVSSVAINVVHDTFEADVEIAVPTQDGPSDVVVDISWWRTQGGLVRKY